ncbi:MAG: polyprenyl synthetase family protein, partial [Candidatus Dormibacteraeota bacterium]|nr:polyprenyl synthetase family protein [Candidatus Dormibacteraeota bacterium]
IGRKTATLLSTCCYCGGVVGGLPDDATEALRNFGYDLGMAFQIADDVLDYIASSAEVGKPVGADLRQGTVTLPLMLALRENGVGDELRTILGKRSLDDSDYNEVVQLVRASPAIAEAERHAHEFVARARSHLDGFADSVQRRALVRVGDYVVDRRI